MGNTGLSHHKAREGEQVTLLGAGGVGDSGHRLEARRAGLLRDGPWEGSEDRFLSQCVSQCLAGPEFLSLRGRWWAPCVLPQEHNADGCGISGRHFPESQHQSQDTATEQSIQDPPKNSGILCPLSLSF